MRSSCSALKGCIEGSPEEEELSTLADAIEAYEASAGPKENFRAARGKRRSSI